MFVHHRGAAVILQVVFANLPSDLFILLIHDKH